MTITNGLLPLPLWVAVVPLGLMGIGFIMLLLPDAFVRGVSGGREPVDISMLPLALGLAMLGVLLTGVHSADALRARQAKDWEQVTARIVRSELVEIMQPRSTTPGWRPDVSYEYRHASRTYQGHRIAFRPLTSSDREGTQAWLEQHYPAGAEIPAYVSPDSPGQAVLDRDGSPLSVWMAGIGVLLAATGLYLLHLALQGLRSPPCPSPRHRKQKPKR